MKSFCVRFLVWVIIPSINMLFWYRYSLRHFGTHSAMPLSSKLTSLIHLKCKEEAVSFVKPSELITPRKACQKDICRRNMSKASTYLELMNSEKFDQYRSKSLAPVTFTKNKNTVIIKHYANESCNKYISDTSGTIIGKFCFAVVRVSGMSSSQNILRSDKSIDESGKSSEEQGKKDKKKTYEFVPNKHNEGKIRPTGFFRNTPQQKGRDRLKEKMIPFLRHFNGKIGIEAQINSKLGSRGFKKGDDIVVMVVNEGEIDLFLNFACSAHFHNISLVNFVVFVGNR